MIMTEACSKTRAPRAHGSRAYQKLLRDIDIPRSARAWEPAVSIVFALCCYPALRARMGAGETPGVDRQPAAVLRARMGAGKKMLIPN